jgi:phosphomannomutase
MVAEIDPYVRSGEINSRVESIPDRIKAVTEAFKDGNQDTEDGLTVSFDDWWFNLRPSNTEPLLRLNIEAQNADLLKEKTDILLGLIRS